MGKSIEIQNPLSGVCRQQPEASLVQQLAESAVGSFFLALSKLAHLNFGQKVPCPALVVIGLEVRILPLNAWSGQCYPSHSLCFTLTQICTHFGCFS